MEAEEVNHVRISIDVEKEDAEVALPVMVTSLEEEMSMLCELTPNHCIYRVPEPLRVKNPAAYTPKVVSIGPIHYRGEGLGAMEEYKRRYLKLFLDRAHLCLGDFAEFVKDREARLRECYADTIHLTSSEFVMMMMVDSAFVYGMLVGTRTGKDGSCRMFDRPFMAVNVMVDLMLLENQIPLFILEDLFNLDNEARSAQQPTSQITVYAREALFMDLVYEFVNKSPDIGALSLDIGEVSSSRIAHLLDCLRRCHLSPLYRDQTYLDDWVLTRRSNFSKLSEKLGYLILHCLWSCGGPSSQSVLPWEEGDGFSVTIPTITELHQSGVKFATNNYSTDLVDIKFDSQQGTLKIPYFLMDDSTESIFRNLLAFEQCDCANDLWLTSYFELLDQLISQPSDVDLLVQSGVVKNSLGDSTKAANMINNMSQGLRMREVSRYDVLCKGLAKYYKVPWHRWKATLRQNYFHNPWAGISVIAAVILLMLTVTQTVYAILSK